jgi:O-antigen/teichoic acid export membrane protein
MSSSWSLKSLSGLKFELLANFAGTGWAAATQLVCIPFFIKFLGIEGFGLVGFYLMLQNLLQIMDLGLSPTINREMARYSARPEKGGEARDLVRTLEVGYWIIGLALGAAILCAAPWIAAHWIRSNTRSVSQIAQAVRLMGILAVFQWPMSFYQGALMGLGRQISFNFLKIAASTLKNGGAVLVLWRSSPTIQAFLVWQIAVSLAQVATIVVLLWSSLPKSQQRPRFHPATTLGVWRFAVGMTGITLTSLLLTQIDKVLVSKLFSLTAFGYYSVAWTVCNGLMVVIVSVFNVMFPRMSAQVAAGDEIGLAQSYHRGSQLMAVLVLPIAAVLCLFSSEAMRIWTRNSEAVSHAAPIVSVLVIGSAINGLLQLPYALQLASGWTRLTLLAGVASCMFTVLAIFPMTRYFGPIGAAGVWALMNLLNLLMVVPIMHRRLLRPEVVGFYRDIGAPLLATIAIATIGRFVFPSIGSSVLVFLGLGVVWLGSSICAVLAAPLIREWAVSQITKQKASYA